MGCVLWRLWKKLTASWWYPLYESSVYVCKVYPICKFFYVLMWLDTGRFTPHISRLLRIFSIYSEFPLKFNWASGNIKGNLTILFPVSFRLNSQATSLARGPIRSVTNCVITTTKQIRIVCIFYGTYFTCLYHCGRQRYVCIICI